MPIFQLRNAIIADVWLLRQEEEQKRKGQAVAVCRPKLHVLPMEHERLLPHHLLLTCLSSTTVCKGWCFVYCVSKRFFPDLRNVLTRGRAHDACKYVRCTWSNSHRSINAVITGRSSELPFRSALNSCLFEPAKKGKEHTNRALGRLIGHFPSAHFDPEQNRTTKLCSLFFQTSTPGDH